MGGHVSARRWKGGEPRCLVTPPKGTQRSGPTLQPWAEMMRMSAGTRSPPLISTRSPTTNSLALICSLSPSRITVACWRSQENPGVRVGTLVSGWRPRCPDREGTQVSWWPHLRDEVLEAGDDVGALELLVVAEAAGDDDDGDEGDGEVQLVGRDRIRPMGWGSGYPHPRGPRCPTSPHEGPRHLDPPSKPHKFSPPERSWLPGTPQMFSRWT